MKQILSLVFLSVGALITNAQVTEQANWQQHVSYNMDVTLDDESHRIVANQSIVYTNNSPSQLDSIVMHLWPNAYKDINTPFAKQQLGNNKLGFYYSDEEDKGSISGLEFKVNGKKVSWDYFGSEDVAVLRLNEPLPSGGKITIETPFTVDIPMVFSRLGHDDQDYYMTQWYPKPAVFDVNGWNPMPYLDQGEFYSEFGDFTVKITLPKNYVVAATGQVMDSSELEFWDERADYPLKLEEDETVESSSETKTLTFKAEQVHDFAWFASKYFNVLKTEVDINDKTVHARVFAYKPKDKHLEAVKTALEFYSEHVGEYPYPHATVVGGELKAGGGMEYPMITVCDVMTEDVIVHEVGHNWFYGILANNERVYPWMDESINSYHDHEATSEGGGVGQQQKFIAGLVKYNMLTRGHQAFGLHSEDYTSMNYGVSVYMEGAKAFRYLNAYLGDSMFTACMRNYYDEWKFKHPLPKDMQTSFENTASEDLSWFFVGMVNADMGIDYKISQKDGQVVLSNVGVVEAPVPVQFTYMESTKTIWHSVAVGESKVIPSPYGDLDQAIVDPKGISFDYNPNNDALNNEPRVKPFFGLKGKGFKSVYVMPSMQWNYHDKFMLGVQLHNMGFPMSNGLFSLKPNYAFGTGQINGSASYTYTKPMKGLGQYVIFGLYGQKYSWKQNVLMPDDMTSNYLKVKPSIEYHFAKKSLRSKVNKKLALTYNYLGFTPNFDLEADRTSSRSPVYKSMAPWQFVNVTYTNHNKRAINGYKLILDLEHGITAQRYHHLDTANLDTLNPMYNLVDSISQFTKLSATFDFKLDIGMKKKPLEIRLFASYFINPSEDRYFNHNIGYAGYQSMRSDYKMDELTMYRSANVGMFRNQIMDGGTQSRFVGVIDASDKLVANAIITVPLPGKIGIKPYVELLTFTDLDKRSWNKSSSTLIYNMGIELRVIPDYFSVYFNVVQSNDVTERQAGPATNVDIFTERITFKLNLSKMMTSRMEDLNIF